MDLVHRLFRRRFRVQALFAHQTLDVLDDDDRVVDQEADRQRQREHNDNVQRHAASVNNAERSQQNDRNREGRNQRNAETLQEKEHNAENQNDRFDQRVRDLLDRLFDDRRVFLRVSDFNARREEFFQFFDAFFNFFRRFQNVRSGGQTQRQPATGVGFGDRFAGFRVFGNGADASAKAVFFAPEFEIGDVRKADLRTVRIRANQDVFKLLFRRHTARRDHRRGELRAGDGRVARETPGGNLNVLLLHRGQNVLRRHIVTAEFVRFEPNAHPVLTAEDLDITDAVDAPERLFQRRFDEVAQVAFVHRTVFAVERNDEEEVDLLFVDAHPLRLDFRRKKRGRERQFVLHLNLRDIRVGSLLEREDNFENTVRGARRVHITVAVEPGHLLLDDLDDGVANRVGGRARVEPVDRDRRRRDVRILRNRQADDRQRPGQHNQDRDDPSENRPFNEKMRHFSPPVAITRLGPALRLEPTRLRRRALRLARLVRNRESF